jgi:hypothetical protein
MNDLPQDVTTWLQGLSLHHRITALRKNLLLAFVDGTLVADVIAATFPRLVELHNYKVTSSAAIRLQNWTMLNRKVLSTVKCELGEEDIIKIANRDIQRGAIIKFMRLLKAKLDDHTEQYFEEENRRAKQQQEKAKKLSKGGTKIGGPNSPRRASAFGVRSLSSAGASSSGSRKGVSFDSAHGEGGQQQGGPSAEAANIRPALARSMHILESKKDMSSVSSRAARMSEQEIDDLYEKVASTLSDSLLEESYAANEQLDRSLNIERHLLALKEQNKEDLKETEKTLHLLHYQLDHLHEQESATANELRAAVDIEKAFRDEQKIIQAEQVAMMSKRSSVIATSLMSLVPDVVDHNNKVSTAAAEAARASSAKLEKEITRRQTKVLDGIGLKIPGINEELEADPDAPVKAARQRLDSMRKSMASGDAAKQAHKVASSSALNTVFSDYAEDQEHVPEASHRRVYDANTQRHFYFEIATGQSAWVSPTEGIIKCVDERTGKAFFTNAATKQVAWTIQEVAM